MPSLIDIRRRIRSVKNTQQITKAMKMVAAARLRKAQDRVIAARPYARMLSETLRNISAAVAEDETINNHPLLAVREENRIALILVTSDRGFAGGFNGNLIKAAQEFIAQHPNQVTLELRGRKGRDYFRRRNFPTSGELTGVSEAPKWEHALSLSETMMERFANEEVDAVYVLFNEFRSVLSQRVTLKKVLPVAVSAGENPPDYIFEQPPAEMMRILLPRYVALEIFHAFLESAASEHAARMTAMDAATSNAAEVIDKLTLHMNRVRQASITKEIIEVVSGAAALE